MILNEGCECIPLNVSPSLPSTPTVEKAVVSEVCVCVSQCVWEGLCPWENEFRWKQTSESVSRQRFKSLPSDNDDEHHVDEGVD